MKRCEKNINLSIRFLTSIRKCVCVQEVVDQFGAEHSGQLENYRQSGR